MRPFLLDAIGSTRFARFALPIAADTVPGFAARLPRAGGLDWFAYNSRIPPMSFMYHRRTVLARRSRRAAYRRGFGSARRPRLCQLGRPLPCRVFRLSPVSCVEDLRRAVVDQGIRRSGLSTTRRRLTTVPFPEQPVDPFFNVNRPEDLETAAALLKLTAR